MELRIKELSFPQAIEFNFEELKAEITAKSALYANMVYTDETIKEAKADKAALNKFIKALEDKRKEVKKECLQPYEAFEKQMKELVAIINEPVRLIDGQVKTYEEKVKAEKLEKIKVYWESCCRPDWLNCSQIFDSGWLNASISLKKVKEAIDERLEQIATDLQTIGNLPEFGFEAEEVYKQTLDINKAISEGQRLADIQKRKEEAARQKAEWEAEQARLKAEAECKHEEVNTCGHCPDSPCELTPPVEKVGDAPARQWVKFAAHLTVAEARELAKFFGDRNIEFKAV